MKKHLYNFICDEFIESKSESFSVYVDGSIAYITNADNPCDILFSLPAHLIRNNRNGPVFLRVFLRGVQVGRHRERASIEA